MDGTFDIDDIAKDDIDVYDVPGVHGVPVLLSLLLLTYSAMNFDAFNLGDLPQDRLQLYKQGIMSGIRNRLVKRYDDGNTSNAEEMEKDASAPEKAAPAKKPHAMEHLAVGAQWPVARRIGDDQRHCAEFFPLRANSLVVGNARDVRDFH